jgi:hypothetical protein
LANKINARIESERPIPVERHYTIKQLAELTGFSDEKIRNLFRNEPGTLKLAGPGVYTGKRPYITSTVPESTVNRVLGRMQVQPEPPKTKRRLKKTLVHRNRQSPAFEVTPEDPPPMPQRAPSTNLISIEDQRAILAILAKYKKE